jgi:hypothetical protein
VTVVADDGVSCADEKCVEILQLNANRPIAASDLQTTESDTVTALTDEGSALVPAPPALNPPQRVQERQILPPQIDDASVLRDQVNFLNEQFKRTDALYRSGAIGGTVDRWAMTGFELAKVRGELALVEGNRADALARFAEAEEFAGTSLKATDAAYASDRVTLDALLEASKNLTDVRRRLIQLRRAPTAAPGERTADDIDANLRRALADQSSYESNTPSLAYCRKAMEQQQINVDRLQSLADKQVVSASELAKAKTELALFQEGLRQAERKLESRRLLVQLAEVEYAQAVEANKSVPSAASELEVKRKKLMVDLAQAKVRELAD